MLTLQLNNSDVYKYLIVSSIVLKLSLCIENDNLSKNETFQLTSINIFLIQGKICSSIDYLKNH